ncbi:hypothetical protein HG263_16575 [Pseudoalteromonas sp. JBTF-M23]|uniref:Uncharacterized protein n=1 Tax=Pseudoalteromonas caenipelagi TaxID=2726988 RepID=A0A849VFU5_9GAMM|nr:hypothetical protein [Pseudoalteromonas caenipelagi]NOU52146.1 hypothetical protein [Pseudoalteromonas caenipelagi]
MFETKTKQHEQCKQFRKVIIQQMRRGGGNGVDDYHEEERKGKAEFANQNFARARYFFERAKKGREEIGGAHGGLDAGHKAAVQYLDRRIAACDQNIRDQAGPTVRTSEAHPDAFKKFTWGKR